MAESYEHNIGQFMRDFSDWVIGGGAHGYGYKAQRRNAQGNGAGHTYRDLTLDGLAGQLRLARERQALHAPLPAGRSTR